MENPSFFRVMIGDFRTTMRIPVKFKKYLSGEVYERSILRVNGGCQWEVKTGVVDGELFFQDGWERLVSDNEITYGEFLVFFYDGDVGFDVKIYATTCCEKKEFVCKVKIEEEYDEPNEEKPSVVIKSRKKSKDGKSNVRKNKLCYKVMKGGKKMANAKALKAACGFRTPHPHFVTSCRNSSTSYLTIPIELVTKYNLDQKNLIVLRDPRGTSWTVRLSSWRDGRRCLSSGWSLLYKKNNLKEGDVCLLEFVQSGNAINIHIFRAREYNVKLIPRSGKRLLTEDEKRRLLKASESFESKLPNFITVWRSCRLYHLEIRMIEVIKFIKMMKEKELQWVRRAVFRGGHLIRHEFSWILPIPKKVAIKVGLNENRSTNVFDPSGRSWPVKITKRSYGQVELGIGWSSFSRGNGLVTGDVCAFEFIEGADAIKVHIFRAEETNISSSVNNSSPLIESVEKTAD